MQPINNDKEPLGANRGYAAFQLAKALRVSEVDPDVASRERARTKASAWMKVIDGMLTGDIEVGSRQPLPEVPVWATPEVMTGGFATGKLMAGGDLLRHEVELAKRVLSQGTTPSRAALNAYYLSERGLCELTTMLQSGRYEIRVPEEGALLVVAWLIDTGRADLADNLLLKLAPHFSQLRFFPTNAEHSERLGPLVFIESVGQVLQRLRSIKPNLRILKDREAIQVWTPLYNRMTDLFLETVDGDWPTIVPNAEGIWVSRQTKRFNITGGWPCLRFSSGWKHRAESLLVEIDQARQLHPLCGRPNRKGDSFVQLANLLRTCASDPRLLTGRDVGMVRLILARHNAKHGTPGSEKRHAVKAKQEAQISGATHHEIRGVVINRLAKERVDSGIEQLDTIVQPVDPMEVSEYAVSQVTVVPASIVCKVARCLQDTPENLVLQGIIKSGETLASVIAQFTGALRAQDFDDDRLCMVYTAIYREFRRRRSLLLFNLEKQVQLEELPWIAAIDGVRSRVITTTDAARLTLREVAMTTLRAFPHAIIPNKLLQEFCALSKTAGMNLPFVEELAADIFMDDFSPKFTEAAQQSAALLRGALYVRYFGVDCTAVQNLAVSVPNVHPESVTAPRPGNPFALMCIERASIDGGTRWGVARNGMVIEQSQILTTHNLALLFQAFNLASDLRPDLFKMATRCFQWICRRQQMQSVTWHAKLIMIKNTAYAWRQMVFYLSHLSPEEVGTFLGWASEYLGTQHKEFAKRFTPALNGLAMVHQGRPIDSSCETVQPFLGWTHKRHWLLDDSISA